MELTEKRVAQLRVNLDILEGLREWDYIETGTLGAYCISTLTKLNGYGGHESVEVEKVLSV